MLDLNQIRTEPEAVKAGLARKGVSPAELDGILELDARRRAVLAEAEALKARKNEASKRVGLLKRQGQDTAALQEEMRAVGDEIARLDQAVAELDASIRDRLLRIPNLPHESVPDGPDESANRVEKTWGTPTEFAFEPKAHDDRESAQRYRQGLAEFVLSHPPGAC